MCQIHRIAFLVALMCPPAFAADSLPALGDSAQTVLTPNQERLLGESIMREIRKDPDFVSDADLEIYLSGLGYRLVAASADNRQDFEFFAVRDDALNAFALPGGFIGIHTGLLIGAQSEAELAAVLAHEIAHVTQRHLARILDKQQQSTMESLAMLVATALLARSKNSALAEAVGSVIPAVALQKQLDFTREHEKEADRVGIQILKNAGFDPRAMPSFLERLLRASRVYDTNSLPDYLRTHPPTTERVADTQNRALQSPYRQTQDSTDFQYLRARLRAAQGDAADAVAHFRGQLQDGRYASEFAARFGLVCAMMRQRDGKAIRAEMSQLRNAAPAHPMIELLNVQVSKLEKNGGAMQTAKQGLQRFPNYLPIKYEFLNTQLEARLWSDALTDIDDLLRTQRGNSRLYEFRARALSGLGRLAEMHQANGEAQALRGNYQAAVFELTEAQKLSSKEFYLSSAIEARLRELRRLEQDTKKAKEPTNFSG